MEASRHCPASTSPAPNSESSIVQLLTPENHSSMVGGKLLDMDWPWLCRMCKVPFAYLRLTWTVPRTGRATTCFQINLLDRISLQVIFQTYWVNQRHSLKRQPMHPSTNFTHPSIGALSTIRQWRLQKLAQTRAYLKVRGTFKCQCTLHSKKEGLRSIKSKTVLLQRLEDWYKTQG